MSLEHVPGTTDQFKFVIDFDVQATDDGNWMLYARTNAGRDWITSKFKMMADPILDPSGASLAMQLIAQEGLTFTIDGELMHG